MEEQPTSEQQMRTMHDSYLQSRQEFDPIFYLIGLAVFVLLFCLVNRKERKEESPKREFTREELREYAGQDGVIYIACCGEVFDVSRSCNYQKGEMY